ncbi:MAG TPA: hypothetical protein VFI39_01385 [Gemmatimonadales bacterium]|nr:hypothetical protein [Gemmatimonadales bacterium]
MVGLADDGQRYYVKGPKTPVVFAEAAGYCLAREAGLAVPEWAFWLDPRDNATFFASREIQIRSGVVDLLRADPLGVAPFLQLCIVIDIWLANPDRNMGNIVLDPISDSGAIVKRPLAIDFEKSQVLRGESRFQVNMLNGRSFWPREELGATCQGLPFPEGCCAVVSAYDEARIYGLLQGVHLDMHIPPLAWFDSAVSQLADRAHKIHELTQEAWS